MLSVAGAGWISREACGSLRRARQEKFDDPKILYQQLEAEGFFLVPQAKVRWLNTVSQRYCLAAALALRDAFESAAEWRRVLTETGVLGLSRDGALQANLEYFKDYVSAGRKLARGNLFVHTLPTSPLAETAITFGFKGPIFHLSAAEPKLNLLIERGEALERTSKKMNFLCFTADENAVIAFLLRSGSIETRPELFSIKEMKQNIGNLGSSKDIFQALKIETESIRN